MDANNRKCAKLAKLKNLALGVARKQGGRLTNELLNLEGELSRMLFQ